MSATSPSTSTSTSTTTSPSRIELQTAFAPQTPQELLQLCADWIAHNEDSDQPIDRDVYGAGSHISTFQSRVATTCGFPAGLFMISGVMSQLIALKIHTRGKNPIFACHPKSHLELHEQGAYEHVLQLSRVYFCAPNDIGSATSITQAISAHWKQPAVIVIEIPNREIGGQCPTWEELLAIREMCDQRGIKLHLDGARLWEARPFYRKSYAEICSVFDSVYVSFYKGLGAMTGAMLLGSEEFIAEAKIWQRRFGGNLYTSLPYVAHADLCFTHHLSSFPARAAKLQRVVAAITEAVKKECGDASSPLRFNPPIPHCSMVHAHITGPRSSIDAAHATVASCDGISVFNRIRPFDAHESYLEWNMGPHNIEIEDDAFVRGWVAFVKELKQQPSQAQTQTQAQSGTSS